MGRVPSTSEPLLAIHPTAGNIFVRRRRRLQHSQAVSQTPFSLYRIIATFRVYLLKYSRCMLESTSGTSRMLQIVANARHR